MTSSWPNSVQTFSSVSPGDSLNSPSHSGLHNDVSDTVEALQNYAGLVFVKSQTIGSGVSSVTVTNAFSATFDNYRVIVTNVVGTSPNYGVRCQIGTMTTGYYGAIPYWNYTGTTGTVLHNNDSFGLAWNNSNYSNVSCVLEVMNPYGSGYTMVNVKSIGNAFAYEGGWSTPTGSHTSIKFFPYLGTWSEGTIKIYGYNNG